MSKKSSLWSRWDGNNMRTASGIYDIQATNAIFTDRKEITKSEFDLRSRERTRVAGCRGKTGTTSN